MCKPQKTYTISHISFNPQIMYKTSALFRFPCDRRIEMLNTSFNSFTVNQLFILQIWQLYSFTNISRSFQYSTDINRNRIILDGKEINHALTNSTFLIIVSLFTTTCCRPDIFNFDKSLFNRCFHKYPEHLRVLIDMTLKSSLEQIKLVKKMFEQ